MNDAKMQGFSLLEILISLLLVSVLLSLVFQNISASTAAITNIIRRIESQDQAISALLLLKHQLEAATTSECSQNASPPYRILKPGDPLMTFWNIQGSDKGDSVGDALLLHQLTGTFYVATKPSENALLAPKDFKGEINEQVVIDDCSHTLIAPINSVTTLFAKGKLLQVQNFVAADFHYPLSVSLLQDRVYYLGRTSNPDSPYALFRVSTSDRHREQIIQNLQALTFSKTGSRLTIQIRPQYASEDYHVSY